MEWNMKKQTGFTLIELIVVMVILGILAAVAVPRFVNLGADARAASANGLAGTLRSAVNIVQARYMATGTMTATTVQLQGQAVTVLANTGLPVATAAGIGSAIDITGFTPDYTVAGVATFTPTGAPATCTVTYTQATGVVNAANATAANC
jgi:MSHA pilin protein MshA